MGQDKGIDVAAVLAAAYRRPDVELDQVANRVRARLAFLETLGESFRLLVEAPLSAVQASLSAASNAKQDRAGGSNDA